MNIWLITIGTVLVALAAAARSAEASTDGNHKSPSVSQPTWLVPAVKPYDLSNVTFEPKIEYPETTRALAKKWAPVFNVPSSWLISQAYTESQNMPLAVNPISKATGVLQIVHVRAKDLVKWIARSPWKDHPMVSGTLAKHWRGNREDLLNPDLNVMLAAFDLNHLRARFGNNHRLVAAAYNQGEGRISRHLAANIPLPPRAVEYVARVERAKRKGYV
jgi:soluble lytic murein transglycosylase-like protein